MSRRLLLLIFIFVVVSSLVFGAVFYFNRTFGSNRIAQVGSEHIYKELYDFENVNTSLPSDLDRESFILEKIIKDSIVLQAASKDGLITLSSTEFNDPDLDPVKRVALVQKVRTMLDERSKNISGELITIWFMNGGVGRLGYEGSKKLARTKIEALHSRVKSGELTMVEAGTIIKNDKELAVIDPSYDTNAYRTFDAGTDKEITQSREFDVLIRNTSAGGVTDIVPITFQETILGRSAEVYYAFAKVQENTNAAQSGSTDFQSWYEKVKNSYKVQIL